MRAKSATGPDDIPPTFLKTLGPRARQELLDIFHLSFSTGKSPQIWKITIFLALKKAGKPPGCISSCRPVSLTSCVANTLKRSLHNWLCTEQAGFRKNRSCEDQILRLTQSIIFHLTGWGSDLVIIDVLRHILDSGSCLRVCFHAVPDPTTFTDNCQQVQPTRPPTVQECTLSVLGDGSGITPEGVVCIVHRI